MGNFVEPKVEFIMLKAEQVVYASSGEGVGVQSCSGQPMYTEQNCGQNMQVSACGEQMMADAGYKPGN